MSGHERHSAANIGYISEPDDGIEPYFTIYLFPSSYSGGGGGGAGAETRCYSEEMRYVQASGFRLLRFPHLLREIPFLFPNTLVLISAR